MLNIKTITLVTGLVSLTCHPQAWAMDQDDLEAPGNLGISPAVQLKMQKLENERLVAQIQLEEERRKTAELEVQLNALQVSSAPPATISQVYKNAEHDVKKTYKKTERDVKKALGLRKKKKK